MVPEGLVRDRQLFQRIQSLEQERSQLLSQQVEAVGSQEGWEWHVVRDGDVYPNHHFYRCYKLYKPFPNGWFTIVLTTLYRIGVATSRDFLVSQWSENRLVHLRLNGLLASDA